MLARFLPERLCVHRYPCVLNSEIRLNGSLNQAFADRAQPVPIECASIYRLWSVLDQIHEGARRIQELLVNLHQAPKGCSSDGCSDLRAYHAFSLAIICAERYGADLRFDTRLDRDLMDVTHLLHVFIEARLSEPLTFAHDLETAMIRVESERRVRKSLKLIAFYSRLYITSQDKHMCALLRRCSR